MLISKAKDTTTSQGINWIGAQPFLVGGSIAASSAAVSGKPVVKLIELGLRKCPCAGKSPVFWLRRYQANIFEVMERKVLIRLVRNIF